MGPAALKVDGAESIAVLRANALGDFIFALPALVALRQAYPDARITLLGRAWHAPFLASRPGPVDEVVVVPGEDAVARDPALDHGDAPWLAASPYERESFIGRMRERHFDVALQLHGGGLNSNPFVAALGARITAGMYTADAVPLDRSIPYVYYQQESARWLEVAALVGAAPVALGPKLVVTDADHAAARAIVPTEPPYVVLHPGATDERRRWPADRFASLGDHLARRGLRVLVTGDVSERGVTAAVVAAMSQPAEDLGGATDLAALIGILAAARLVVSNDSGPMHLAIAVGTPTVGLYWVGNLINGGPLTRALHRPVLSWRRHCTMCGTDCVRQRCDHDASFLDEAPLEDAIEASEALLAEPAERRSDNPQVRG